VVQLICLNLISYLTVNKLKGSMSQRQTQARDKVGWRPALSQLLSILPAVDNIIATVHRLYLIELCQSMNFKYMCVLKQTIIKTQLNW